MFRRFMFPILAVVIACPVVADEKKPVLDEAAMMKHATPGEHHKKLQPMIGDWTYTAAFTMVPDSPAMEMKGIGTRKWIMDGRFMHDDAKNDGGPMPFHGLGITGYDNSSKKYIGFWIDSMTTSFSTSTGEVDAAGKVFTFRMDEFNPMYGQKVKSRQVITVQDNDHHTMEFHTTPPGGKEFKTGTIKFTRKK